MPNSKPWYESRTIWFNIAGFIVQITTVILASPQIEATWIPTLMLLQTLGNLVLRFKTTTGIE